jgi:hypothetical protein
VSRSANLDFFAVDLDQEAILDFLFGHTDVRVFDSYSLPDAALREFKSTAEIAQAYELGMDENGGGTAVLLQLWSPSVMSDLVVTRFALDPTTCEGHTFRYRIDGRGLIQLYFRWHLQPGCYQVALWPPERCEGASLGTGTRCGLDRSVATVRSNSTSHPESSGGHQVEWSTNSS